MTPTQKQEMWESFCKGKTLEAIAKPLHITRERVRQLLSVHPKYKEFSFKNRRKRSAEILKKAECLGCHRLMYFYPSLVRKTHSRECERLFIIQKRKKEFSLPKICKRCKVLKPASEFFLVSKCPNKNSEPYHMAVCKKCHFSRCNSWRKKNPEKVRVLQRRAFEKYYRNNREKVLARSREYFQENKERLMKYQREYRRKRKLKLAC